MTSQQQVFLLQQIRNLLNEIICRREHAVEGDEYLFYIENTLRDILWEAEKDLHKSPSN